MMLEDGDVSVAEWPAGLPLTSSFLLEYSSEYLNEYSLVPKVL